MKTFDEILERLCHESYGMSFIECCDKIVYHGLKTIAGHAAKEYAEQCVKGHLSRAADESLLSKVGISIEQWQVLHKSITNIDIHLP